MSKLHYVLLASLIVANSAVANEANQADDLARQIEQEKNTNNGWLSWLPFGGSTVTPAGLNTAKARRAAAQDEIRSLKKEIKNVTAAAAQPGNEPEAQNLMNLRLAALDHQVKKQQQEIDKAQTTINAASLFVAGKAFVLAHPVVTATAVTVTACVAVAAVYKWRKAVQEKRELEAELEELERTYA